MKWKAALLGAILGLIVMAPSKPEPASAEPACAGCVYVKYTECGNVCDSPEFAYEEQEWILVGGPECPEDCERHMMVGLTGNCIIFC